MNNSQHEEVEAPDYEVGYARPPVSTRFKPGRSGNPQGRPKGSKSFSTMIRDLLEEKIEVRTSRGTRKMSKAEALLTSHINNALKGDAKATLIVLKMAQAAGYIAPADSEDLDTDQGQLNAEDLEILNRLAKQQPKRNAAKERK